MALTNGIKLGPYEIVAALGAGGMGEIYRARDTRLERTVAIKIDVYKRQSWICPARDRVATSFQRCSRAGDWTAWIGQEFMVQTP